MATIKDSKGQVLAHHTTESCLSHYGQAVWVVEDPDPEPGPATLYAIDNNPLEIDLLEVKGGWLVVRLPDTYLAGIIWSDGPCFINYLVDGQDRLVRELGPGVHVQGTIVMDPDDPDDLGAILM